MSIMHPFRNRRDEDTDDLVVIIESDDHEALEFHAGSQEELDAKVDDFHTWAS